MVTTALEHEARLSQCALLLDYYAPTGDGRLDPGAMPDATIHEVAQTALSPQIHARLSTEALGGQLRWKHLSYQQRFDYLTRLKEIGEAADPPTKLDLQRIEDPKVSPSGKLAPSTLEKTLSWEGARLGIFELITDDHFQSRDQLCADLQWVGHLRPDRTPVIHAHHVVELADATEVADLGPKIVGLQGLLDLAVFVDSVLNMTNAFDQKMIEVCQADGLAECAQSLASGVIDEDVISIHKLHGVGLRCAIYGDGLKLGLEVRGVPAAATQTLDLLLSAVPATLAQHLPSVPPAPWEGWNAGELGLGKKAYEQALQDPKFSDAASTAVLDFEEIAETGAVDRADTFRFLAPLWNYEALPFISETQGERITAARDDFVKDMLDLSTAIARAIDAGEDVPQELVGNSLRRLNLRFFTDAGLGPALHAAIRGFAAGTTPISAE